MTTDTRSDLDRMIDNQNALDNIKGVFRDLDDGGLTDEEALAQVRDLLDVKPPLPPKLVLTGTLPFTVTVDTGTKEVLEFEINYDFPTFERKAETRQTGGAIDIAEAQLEELIAAADNSTGSWPDPERM